MFNILVNKGELEILTVMTVIKAVCDILRYIVVAGKCTDFSNGSMTMRGLHMTPDSLLKKQSNSRTEAE